jgi:predicted metal-dependent enzyme (double-stranded beta helix superfamily)
MLQQDLLSEFERDGRGPEAARILAAYASRHDDWRRFAFFDRDAYTRNLVARNEHFKMIVLCWSVRKTSPIHNHAQQNCWMAVLEGEIEETQYRLADGSALPRLVPSAARTFTSGRVAFINDDIALHRVRPLPGTSGISLHVYSKPIDVCTLYDEKSGRVTKKTLAYHSTEGTLVGT